MSSGDAIDGVRLPKRPRRKAMFRGLRRAALCLSVLPLLLCGGYGVWYARAKCALDAVVAEIAAQGEPVAFHEMKPAPIAPTDDAFPILRDVESKWNRRRVGTPEFWQAYARGCNAVHSHHDHDDCEAEFEYLKQSLLENQAPLQLLRRALACPTCDLPIEYDAVLPGSSHHAPFSHAFCMLHVEFLIAYHQGEMPKARDAVHDLCVLSLLLRSDPTLSGQFLRLNGSSIGVAGMQMLAGNSPQDAQYVSRLDQCLQTMEQATRLKRAILAERAQMLSASQYLADTDGFTDFGGAVADYDFAFLAPYLLDDQAYLLHRWGQLAQVVDSTGPAARYRQRLLTEKATIPPDYAFTRRFSGRIWLAPGQAMCYRQLFTNARVGLRVAQHYWRHGKLPQSLEEIVGDGLPHLPTCLYSGQQLIYRRRADGFCIYAPCDNGEDDGCLDDAGLGNRRGNSPDKQEPRSAFEVTLAPFHQAAGK